jgi:hypothetical protein
VIAGKIMDRIVHCILLALIVTAAATGSGEVAYFSYVSDIPDGYGRLMAAPLTDVSHADDSPFTEIQLPWSFNFLGTNVNGLFVSPNGALHYSPKQPCPNENYFASNVCDFDNSYYTVIAGYLTDLNPSKSARGSIELGTSSTVAEVSFNNISYYNSTISNSFRVRLWKDSHIEILYDRVIRTSQLPQAGFFASGLRGAAANPYAYFTAAQINLARSGWGTEVPSVYPEQIDVVTGKRFTICPVSRTWCMQPAVVNRNAAALTVLELSALLLSCTAEVSYSVQIANTTSTFTAACSPVGMSTTLHCDVTAVLADGMTAGNWTVTPAWNAAPHGALDTVLPVDGINLHVVDDATSTQAVANCSTNMLAGSLCSDNPCSLCSGNFTCLQLPCASNADVELSSASTNGIFERLSCAGSCPAEGITQRYYTDTSSPAQCCLQSAMDCSGRCGGPAVAALDTSGARYCCPDRSRVDCAGVCDGGAVRDVCGTCQGTDFTGLGCFTSNNVLFTTGSGDGNWHPVFDMNITASGGLVRRVRLNVTNNNPFVVQVALSEASSTALVSPVLTIPAAARIVGINSTITFEMDLSIELLFYGNATAWVAKTVTATYFRPSYPQAIYKKEIRVYPEAVNCGTVSSREACIRLPACIFCVTNPNMRLLRDSAAQRRKLIVEVIPDRAVDGGDGEAGMCGDGWMNQDCARIAPASFANSAPRIRAAPTLVLLLLQLVQLLYYMYFG